MSRYVKKKYGMVIGSDNCFFYRDEDDNFRDFPAILGIRSLYFEDYSTAHVGVRSLAEQFIWREEKVEVIDEIDKWPRIVTKLHLRSYPKHWLDKNAPGYGISPTNKPNDCHIFFAKRGHAVAFTRMVEAQLSGMTYL